MTASASTLEVAHHAGGSALWQRAGVSARRLATGAAVVMTMRLLGSGAAFVWQLALARWLGAEQFGMVAWLLAAIGLLTMLGKCGWEAATLRFVPAYLASHEWSLLRGFRRLRDVTALICAVGVASLTGLGVWLSGGIPGWQPALTVALFVVPVAALLEIGCGDLRSQSKFVWSDGLAHLARPLLALGILAIIVFVSGVNGSASTAVWIWFGTSLVMLCVVRVRAALQWPTALRRALPAYAPRAWLTTVLPLFGVVACNVVLTQTDVLILGAFADARTTGIYSAAVKLANLSLLGLAVINSVGAPLIAEQHARGTWRELAKTARWMALGATAIAFPATLMALCAGTWLLSWFGAEFTSANGVLAVLCLGQLVGAACGSVVPLLAMTGQQNILVKVLATFAAAHVLISLVLVPWLGMWGAAMGTTCCLIGWNVTLAVVVARTLRINPTILPWQVHSL